MNHFPIYAPGRAQLIELPVAEGKTVISGQQLLRLHAPELLMKRRTALARIERLRWQVASAGFDAEQRLRVQILQEELASAQAELAGVSQEQGRYAPTAPFAGRLRDLDPDLRPGVWVAQYEHLAVLVGEGKWQAETYLDEEAVARVAVGDRARFYSDGLEGPFAPMTVLSVEHDVTRVLPNGILAAQHGGSVVTRENNGQFIPDRAVYRVMLVMDADPENLKGNSWRGRVIIAGAWEAPGLSFARAALALFWREAGL